MAGFQVDLVKRSHISGNIGSPWRPEGAWHNGCYDRVLERSALCVSLTERPIGYGEEDEEEFAHKACRAQTRPRETREHEGHALLRLERWSAGYPSGLCLRSLQLGAGESPAYGLEVFLLQEEGKSRASS